MNFVGMKVGLDQLHPSSTAEGWLAYKDLAPSLLQRAMDLGNPEAYQFAAEMYSQTRDAGRILPYDPVKAIAIFKALRQFATDDYKQALDNNINSRMANLTSEQLPLVDAEMARVSASLATHNQAPISGVPQQDRASYCDQN